MTGEKERKNREELFRLMQGHPELPVVPMVDSDIVADDGGYWIGSWGSARIDEYLIAERSGKILFRSDGDVFDALYEYLSYEEYEDLPEADEGCRPYYDNLPWVKAIIVYINLPER